MWVEVHQHALMLTKAETTSRRLVLAGWLISHSARRTQGLVRINKNSR